MKESTRRIVLFATIVITGSIMILFDIPLIIMIPLVIVVGIVILFAIGAITPEDIRSSLTRIRSKGTAKAVTAPPAKAATASKPADSPKKAGFLNRLRGFQISFRKNAGTSAAPAVKPEKKPEKKDTGKGGEKTTGIGGHISSFFSSLKSLGTVIQAKSKTPRKVGDINKQLDATVSEKIPAEKPPLPVAPAPAGGAGSAAVSASASADADPFLSLSDDEFDAGLLDGLDDMDAGSMQAPAAAPVSSDATAEPALPAPSLELDAASAEILKSQEPVDSSLDEFSGLEGGGAMDSEFGDLDNISLDDVDMDVELDGDMGGAAETDSPEAAVPSAPTPDMAAPPAAASGDSNVVKTAWIPSDAPKEQTEDQISTHSDMAAFASGPQSDEDMLSSLASDVKTVKKEKNISLLRELKDFKAPATEIETELDDVFKKIASVKQSQAKKTDPTSGNGMK